MFDMLNPFNQKNKNDEHQTIPVPKNVTVTQEGSDLIINEEVECLRRYQEPGMERFCFRRDIQRVWLTSPTDSCKRFLFKRDARTALDLRLFICNRNFSACAWYLSNFRLNNRSCEYSVYKHPTSAATVAHTDVFSP